MTMKTAPQALPSDLLMAPFIAASTSSTTSKSQKHVLDPSAQSNAAKSTHPRAQGAAGSARVSPAKQACQAAPVAD
jgi:hypothetical protein